MKKVSFLILLLIGSLFAISCEGEDGLDGQNGQDGINGLDGRDGQDGEDGEDGENPPAQSTAPFGFVEDIWNNFDIEDRRVNRNPGDIGVGDAVLIRDENNHFFYELSSFNTSDSAGTEYYVYTTVAGASLDTQNGFAEDERPRQVMNLEGTAPFTITNDGGTIFIPLTTPPGPAASGRMFDWIVIYPATGADTSMPGIVADLDASDLMPRKQIWNVFDLEDRTALDQGIAATTNNGTARLITNQDQGRTQYWIELDGFQNVNQPIVRGNGNIVAERFAVFAAVAGAGLGVQGGFDASERPVFIGFVDANGDQYVPLLEGDVADLEAENGRGIQFNLNNGGVALNDGGYVIPQRATGGNNRWYDWVILHPIDANGLRPITYPSFAADLDADDELSQNQRRSAGRQ
ncbi:hypothetical protein [Winogradskyella immobilis]|uniref:Collagen-like protein n=1 Tax=Winogradskyella immobilis TaxID=2816852 RepID=A0ABS8EJS5_9FLAO|nr:hypothetical protein [Winogradskyella immobilis]MCC1483449.1 hypothetical protein [Winogradskyella immobilis]MCG0015543.1 hypothetical protein [Winogradskyella immobilis]